jgi:HEAT repeats
MIKLNLLLFRELVALTKGMLQVLLLTRLTKALLCGFVVGSVLGAKLGSALWFPSTEHGAQVKGEAVYQGKPASFWIGQLQDQDPFFRLEAVQALEHIGPKDNAVVCALARMLKDRNEGVRIATALALGRFGPDAASAIPELIGCLKDQHRYVRVHAIRTVGNIGPSDPAVLPAVLAALQDEEPVVRRVALEALGTMGPRAKIALHAIRNAQKDSNPEVRQEAIDVLKKIDRQEGSDEPLSERSTSENEQRTQPLHCNNRTRRPMRPTGRWLASGRRKPDPSRPDGKELWNSFPMSGTSPCAAAPAAGTLLLKGTIHVEVSRDSRTGAEAPGRL